MVAVADTGHGMTEEVMRQIFEPFFSTKEVGKGTGLGLSMVYGFVRQSEGHVAVQSAVGSGTTFRLYLPVAEAAPVAAPAPAAPGDEPPAGVLRGTETILVVEDDPDVRAYAVSLLADLGYRVVEAENGSAGLAILRQRQDIDLLFSDVVMPGTVSGADLAKAALDLRPGIRIILASGYGARFIAKDGRLGAVPFLQKPYRAADLSLRLRQVLDEPAIHRTG
jgi:CheY-like chemotaxis protein